MGTLSTAMLHENILKHEITTLPDFHEYPRLTRDISHLKVSRWKVRPRWNLFIGQFELGNDPQFEVPVDPSKKKASKANLSPHRVNMLFMSNL